VLVFSRPSPSLRIEVQAEVRGAGAATWTPGADAARDAADGVRPDPAVAEFARRHAPGGSALQDALALSDALDRRLDYDPSATSTRTTAAEALALGRGVCQDFSQILVEALESLGHRARYVGGWLLRESGTAMDFMGGELHAWVAVDAGEGRWHAIDPCAGPVGPDHLPLAWGSRFADVVPVTFPGPAAAPRCLGTTVTARRTETDDPEAARS
jgi:transglutaminase-like putative cysteine protease